ncbi:hypothetical protein SOVF_065940 [Spinacia oleracea]|nr:hypothetical protein SOVF_065940 [Spinacia oleracea]
MTSSGTGILDSANQRRLHAFLFKVQDAFGDNGGGRKESSGDA